jgi:signal transduction histidine kinase
MKNFFKKYLWLFEFFGVAIILAVGIFAFVKEEVFLYIAGFALIVFGLFRIYPLVKTTKDQVLKIIFTIEIAFNIIAGIFLVLEGGKENYNQNLMRYLVGSVLYIRGAIYFFATVIRKEATDYAQFITHLIFITLGLIIMATKFFTIDNLAWVVLIIAIISALFIGASGYRNYKNFRYEGLAREETKKIKKPKVEKNVIEDPKPAKDNVIIPEEEKREELNL